MKFLKQKLRLTFWRRCIYLKTQLSRASCEDMSRRGLLEIGRHTYGHPTIDSYSGSEARVIIGHFCSISPGVLMITGGIHPIEWVSTFPFRTQWNLKGAHGDGTPATRGDIIIGSDVWIGTEAMILSGVSIGHGAVIAARSVVSKDVPPYAIAAGVPAKVVRYRFDEDTIKKLLEIRWWEWDDDRIREAVLLLSSTNVAEFIARYHVRSHAANDG